MTGVEIFGYLSMSVVLFSMLLKDMITLRIVNSAACAMFIVYGFMIGAYPVIVMNFLVIAINMYRIFKKS
jgi:hypothetical protein